MLKRLLQIAPLLLLIFTVTAAKAASFECKLAETKVEALICGDPSISKLDEQLSATYAQIQKKSRQEKAEKAMQHLWLKSRNLCVDVACLVRVYESRISELQARSASASPIVGVWKKEFSCARATGIYEERCKQGARDVFELAVQESGSRACVSHRATGQLGNRVDEVEDTQPSMTGPVNGNVATVRFSSIWGGTGTARLRVEGNSLHWKVVDKDTGESWIPDEEVLHRVPAGPYDRLPDCAGT